MVTHLEQQLALVANKNDNANPLIMLLTTAQM
jgi:hypothetical protein